MIGCKVYKKPDGRYDITDQLHQYNDEPSVIFSISERLFKELLSAKYQKELTFLFDLHTGAL